jgi:hypothetical protein
MFTLVVDNFRVCYTNKANVNRLLQVLQQEYQCSTDWTGARYIGLTLAWDYIAGTCDISMPGYIDRALNPFAHPKPTQQEHAPHPWKAPVYGARQQFTQHDDAPFVDAKDKKLLQEILGTLLYYAQAIDGTMIEAIRTIPTQQATPTTTTMADITQLLNYCATHPDAVVRFNKSDMILHVESDALYLSETKARSCFSGYHYLSSRPVDPSKPPESDAPQPALNEPISIPAKILRETVSSVAKAKLAGLFYNGKEAVRKCITLGELCHHQPPTPMVTDNSTASGIANDSIKQRRSKAMDMQYYWIRDRVRQGQFHVYWKRGCTNCADYYSKHHLPTHHQRMRPEALQEPKGNYYAALATDSKDDPQLPSITQHSSGEGVLIPSHHQAGRLAHWEPEPLQCRVAHDTEPCYAETVDDSNTKLDAM